MSDIKKPEKDESILVRQIQDTVLELRSSIDSLQKKFLQLNASLGYSGLVVPSTKLLNECFSLREDLSRLKSLSEIEAAILLARLISYLETPMGKMSCTN